MKIQIGFFLSFIIAVLIIIALLFIFIFNIFSYGNPTLNNIASLEIGETIYYNETYIQPLVSYYITLPEYDSGEPIILSLYGVGDLYMNGIYNETCNIFAGGQINISSCNITKIQ